ncbi:Methyltransferase domain-containing protein [Actinomadura meyerae]|jgi:SAM-dependent methyltransferase|uniref:Methyltransferase domain-containing protein n=1 Tax=Actinomadura meyerae TaxID=240840 RepID=A0A239JUI1_9ACTN|nr:methyltransferase domain-containing protein [Actinomadura meyerae]SNT08534.1 Methyltransferase domain-containing protein [Actinomadura meyerae]
MQSPGQKKSIAGSLLGLLGSAPKKGAPAAGPAPHVNADGDVVQPAAGEGALENHLGGDEARNYRKYEYETVAPHVGRSMLEVGSGLGHFSEQFAGRLDYLVVSDNDPYCVGELRGRYDGNDDVEVIDLALPAEIKIRRKVDTVVMMNVLEHIKDDVQALRDLAAVTEPGGRIVIWVPGYMQLYGDFDRKVGHVTRYTPQTLEASVREAGLVPEVLKPINFLGGIAWWFAVRRGGAGYPDPRLVKIYDRTVVPVTRTIERFVRPPFGQTVFCVARVPR